MVPSPSSQVPAYATSGATQFVSIMWQPSGGAPSDIEPVRPNASQRRGRLDRFGVTGEEDWFVPLLETAAGALGPASTFAQSFERGFGRPKVRHTPYPCTAASQQPHIELREHAA